MENIIAIGLDMAKTFSQICRIVGEGGVINRKAWWRSQMLELFRRPAPNRFDAYASSYRRTPMEPRIYVEDDTAAACVERNNTGAARAEAICQAAASHQAIPAHQKHRRVRDFACCRRPESFADQEDIRRLVADRAVIVAIAAHDRRRCRLRGRWYQAFTEVLGEPMWGRSQRIGQGNLEQEAVGRPCPAESKAGNDEKLIFTELSEADGI